MTGNEARAMNKPSYERPVYVVDGARSPFLKARLGPGPLRASDLTVQVGQALLARHPAVLAALDEVILGATMAGADEANIARAVALRLGCPIHVPA